MLPEVGGLEWLIIALVALVVVGPKDLPVLLRRLGQFVAKLRGMAADFRASFDEIARQSELDDLRREVDAMRRGQYADLAASEAHTTLSEVDRTLAEMGADLNSPPYQLTGDADRLAPPAPETPKPVRKRAAKPKGASEGGAAAKTPARKARARKPAGGPA